MWQEETITSAHGCLHSKKRDSDLGVPIVPSELTFITCPDLGGQGTRVTMTDSQQQSLAFPFRSALHSHCHRKGQDSLPPFPGNLCTNNPLAWVTHTLTLFPTGNITKRQSSWCFQGHLWRGFIPQLWNSFCEISNKNKNQALHFFFSPFGSHRHIHSLVCVFQSALQVVLRPYKYLNPLCSVVTKMASECHLHSHPGVLSELPECITNYLLQSHLTSHSTVPKHFFIFHLWDHTLDSLNSTSYWLVAPSLPTKGDINCSCNTLHALPLPYPYWCCSFISTVSSLCFFF